MRRGVTGWLIGVVGLLSACGPGVHDLSDEAGALVVVTGQAERMLPGALPPETEVGDLRLRAGLLWAGVPEIHRYCLEHGANPLAPGRAPSEVAALACPDLLGVAPALMDVSVPVDAAAGGLFELPLSHVPSAEVMVGTIESRIAYGTLVLFDDVNDNGTLDLIASRRPPREGRGGGPGGGRRDDDERKDEGPPDVVYGASFSSLLRPQTRVAFREGAYDLSSVLAATYYPAWGCDAPPRGFSVLTVDGTPLSPSCATDTLEAAPLWVPVAPPETLGRMRCLPPPAWRTSSRPREQPLEGWLHECVSSTELVAVDPEETDCPVLDHQVLAGCDRNPWCETEQDWDLREEPPQWWPCTAADDPVEAPGEGRGPRGPGR